MAAHTGVDTTYDLTTPGVGYTQSASKEQSVDIVTIRDEDGITKVAKPKKTVTTTQTISGKGDPELSAVTAGAFAEDTLKIVSAKGTENNGDFPDFEITGHVYSSL